MIRPLCYALISVVAWSWATAGSPLAQDRAGDVIAQARHAISRNVAAAGVSSLSIGAKVRRVLQASGGMEVTSDVQLEFLLPERFRRTESMTFGAVSREITMGLNGNDLLWDDGGAAALLGRDPTAPGLLQEQTKLELRREAFRLLTVWLLAPPLTPPAAITYAGVAEAPDGKADVVDVQGGPGGLGLRLFLDTASHRLLMATYVSQVSDPDQAKAIKDALMEKARKDPQNARKLVLAASEDIEKLPKKAITVEMHFSDYRAIGGVTLPGTMVVDTEGQGQEEWTIVSCTLNAPIKPERFERR
jgi:hypothetical protein